MRKSFNFIPILLFFSLFTEGVLAQSDIEKKLQKAEKLSYTQLDSALYIASIALTEAQKLDSFRLVFNCFRTIGLIYEDNNRFAEAQKNYALALDLAETRLGNTEKFQIYTDWAIIHKKLGQYKIAYDFHWRTITEATKVSNWKMVENGYHGLGTMYSMMSDFDKSAQSYLKSIEAAEKSNNQKGIALTRQNLGNIYNKAKNYDLALQNIRIAHDMAQKLGDSTRIGAVLSIYGNIENALGNLDSAVYKLQSAAQIFEKRQDKPRLADIYLSLAGIYAQQQKPAAAEDYFNRSAALQTFSSKYAYADLYQKRGQFYQSQNKIEVAKTMFEQSLRSTDSFGFKEIARANHLALATIFEQNRQFDSAFFHQKKADNLAISLFADSKQKAMSEAQFKFDVEKRDLQIEAQQKQISQSKILRGVLFGGLALLAGLLFFTWRQMKAKQKLALQAELMMKELHHRVKNNLQILASIMRLQTRQANDPSVAAILNESRSRLEAISMIHQQLYRNNDVQSVNFKLFLEDLVQKQAFAFGMDDKKLETQFHLDDDFINVDIALPLGLIINELLTNSFKYAYGSVEKPVLVIEIESQKLFYADNGIGLPSHFDHENNKSFGIQLIMSLSKQLHGKFQFGTNNGMFFKLTF